MFKVSDKNIKNNIRALFKVNNKDMRTTLYHIRFGVLDVLQSREICRNSNINVRCVLMVI